MHFTEIFLRLEIKLPEKHNFIEHEFILHSAIDFAVPVSERVNFLIGLQVQGI